MDPTQNPYQPNPAQTPYRQPPVAPKYNTMAVVGFVLTFIVPLIGFVLCIVALNQIKQTGEKGKRLAKAGIVIFIAIVLLIAISIGAAVFLSSETKPDGSTNTSSGVVRARDTDRKNTISMLHNALESYYNRHGVYPALSVITSGDLPGINPEDLRDPSGRMIHRGTDEGDYSYVCVQGKGGCASYTLVADMEATRPDPLTRNSLH